MKRLNTVDYIDEAIHLLIEARGTRWLASRQRPEVIECAIRNAETALAYARREKDGSLPASYATVEIELREGDGR